MDPTYRSRKVGKAVLGSETFPVTLEQRWCDALCGQEWVLVTESVKRDEQGTNEKDQEQCQVSWINT